LCGFEQVDLRLAVSDDGGERWRDAGEWRSWCVEADGAHGAAVAQAVRDVLWPVVRNVVRACLERGDAEGGGSVPRFVFGGYPTLICAVAGATAS